MSVYKEPRTNTWKVYYRYTDWQGERKQTTKRGFATKREALAWEREQMHKVQSDLDMTFASFVEVPHQGEHLAHEGNTSSARSCCRTSASGRSRRSSQRTSSPGRT